MKLPKLGDYFGISVITLGNLVSNGIGAAIWLFLASIMEVDSYGEINFYVSLATVVGVGASLGMDTVLLTYIPKEKDRRTFNQATTLTFLTSAGAALLVMTFVNWQSALLVLGVVYFTLNTGEILGSLRYKEYAAIIISERAARLALSILFFFLIGPVGILLGFAISHIVLSLRFMQALRNFSLEFSALRSKLHFSAYSLGWSLLQILPTILDKSIIIFLFGFTTLGLYQLGMQFVSMAGILPTSIYQFMLPKRSGGKISSSIIKMVIMISMSIALLYIFVSPLVIDLFFQNFKDAKLLVQLTGVAIIPLTITAMMNSILQANEKARLAFIGGLVYIATLLSGIVALGQSFGVSGLGISFLAAHSSQAVFTSLSAKYSK